MTHETTGQVVGQGQLSRAAPDLRDLIAGGVMLVLGGAIAIQALRGYNIGSLGHIGPGMLPMAMGLGMAATGALIALAALFRPRVSFGDIDLRALGWVTASGLAFAWLAPRFGMLPAVAGLVLVASLANREVTLPRAVLLAVGLSGLCYVIFSLGLGVALPPLRWNL
jgi:hypothetical protein